MNPIEPSEQCPNCGQYFPIGHCHHHSASTLKIPGAGSYSSTLYGVCENCATAHKERYAAISQNEARGA